jgi:hypothetical protein
MVASDRRGRRQLPTNSKPEALKTNVHASSPVLGGKVADGAPSALPAAVVATVTATGAAEPPVTLTEAGTVQTGAGVTAGVRPQVRLTVPLNDPTGVRAKPKVAVSPAEIVDELDPPDAIPIVKSGAAFPVPDNARSWDPEPALSAIIRFALAAPAAVGVKVILIVQLVNG